MKWFPGSIAEAVTTSKQRKAIFVVFIEGKDETSTQFAAAINETEVSVLLERDNFVAIRLENDSEAYRFFNQIYQVASVPSLFFIGTNGVPLEVVSGSITCSDLKNKIDTVLQSSEKTPSVSSTSLIDAEKNTESASNIPKAPSSVEENITPVRSTENVASSSDVSSAKEPTTEEKLERAKQLIELQRRQKIEKEREEEKRREIERRKLGKDVQMAKQKQHEAEIKLAYEERMREKAAEAAAKERVRQQIAQDKLERKQKELALQQQFSQQQQQEQQNQQERVEVSTGGSSSGDGSTARIQFRLPSGKPHMGKFDANSTFGSLRSYVANNIELPFQHFAMSTSFPRRDLTVDDDTKTLTELELVPTAVILILPVKNSKITTVVTTTENVGFVSRFIWALFAPIFSIYNYVVGYFTGAPASPPEQRRNDGNLASGGLSDNSERFGQSVGQPSGSNSRNPFVGGPATTIRSRGNIHRLHSGSDDNDENNTWNGNSTQQM